MTERKPQTNTRKISRRDLLILLGSVVAVGGIAVAPKFISRGKKEEPNNQKENPTTPEQDQPFVPSIEISDKIDAESFKKIVTELYEFAFAEGKISQNINFISPSNAYIVEILVKTEDGMGDLSISKGVISKNLLGAMSAERSAYTIGWNAYNKPSKNFPERCVAFSQFQEPAELCQIISFNPKNNEPEPQLLSNNEMADFLKKTIDFFNRRIPGNPSQENRKGANKGYV